EKGFDTAPADLSESGPRLSLTAGAAHVERARHQEVSISRRLGSTSVQLAGFSDHLRNAALIGTGGGDDSADFLPDVYSDTFTFNGGTLATRGMRVVVQQKLLPDLNATVAYSLGNALTLEEGSPELDQLRSALRTARRHAVTGKLAGSI